MKVAYSLKYPHLTLTLWRRITQTLLNHAEQCFSELPIPEIEAEIELQSVGCIACIPEPTITLEPINTNHNSQRATTQVCFTHLLKVRLLKNAHPTRTT